jgi:hypothetical protein
MRVSTSRCRCCRWSLEKLSNISQPLLAFAMATLLVLIPRVAGGDTDFRITITTELVDGVEVHCQTADLAYYVPKRRILPEDTEYTFPFDDNHPAFLKPFLCRVVDSEGREMTFTAWDLRLHNERWKFPEFNDMRDIRWTVNNAGVWVYLKGRKHVDALMRWMLAGIWPHLQSTNQW